MFKKLKYLFASLIIAITTTSCEIENLNESHTSKDQVSYDLIHMFGSVKAPNAVIDNQALIDNLKIGSSRLSYNWVGDCSLEHNWGTSDKSDSSKAYAVVGYKTTSGEWIAAKFDWISTSRNTRDYANINSGYNGFNKNDFYAANEYVFFILHKNCQLRTNTLYFKK